MYSGRYVPTSAEIVSDFCVKTYAYAVKMQEAGSSEVLVHTYQITSKQRGVSITES